MVPTHPIVVSDMEKAYQQLRAHKVEHTSTGPQRIPDWNKAAAGIKAFYFKIRTATIWS